MSADANRIQTLIEHLTDGRQPLSHAMCCEIAETLRSLSAASADRRDELCRVRAKADAISAERDRLKGAEKTTSVRS